MPDGSEPLTILAHPFQSNWRQFKKKKIGWQSVKTAGGWIKLLHYVFLSFSIDSNKCWQSSQIVCVQFILELQIGRLSLKMQ